MTNLKDIKNRIQSVQSTKKITRAMKMVAAAKVKKAENTVKASRPFTHELNTMFRRLLNSVGSYSSETLKVKQNIDNYPELLQIRADVKNVGLLVITSNKGLAGAYNANVIRKTQKKIEEYNAAGIKTTLFIVGQKGISAFKKRSKALGCEIAATYAGVANNPTGEGAKIIAEDMADAFVKGEIDSIEIVTTRFKNMMSYKVEDWKILPAEDIKKALGDDETSESAKIDPLMAFEPDVDSILQKIVPMFITNIIYQALLEAVASELAARMTAMSAATNNAEEMIRVLSVDYNKARQAAITNEILEVVSGADALKK